MFLLLVILLSNFSTRVGALLILALFLSKNKIFKKLVLKENINNRDKILLSIIFGAFGIIGTYMGIPVNKNQEVNMMSNFVLTLELKTEKWQKDILDRRFNIGRQIYNACLGELFKRYNTMIQRKQYKKAVNMPKGKERNKKFQELNKKYDLTEYSLHTYVKPMQHYFKENIDSFNMM